MSVFFLGSFFLFLIQFATPHIWGADGYLHIYLAKLTRQSGFIQSLPQLPFSLFATQFSNKDWLYHLFAAPLTFLPHLTLAAKIFALLNTLIFLAILLFIIRKNSPSLSKLPYLAILLLATSFDFLTTISRPRPMVLSFALMLLSLYLLSRKKIKLFLLTTIFYTAWHTSGPLLSIFFAATYALIHFIKTKKLPFRFLFLTVLTISLGILIHPNFPNNLYDRYLTTLLIPWYTNRWGVLESGAEFFPLSFIQYLKNYPLLIPLNGFIFYSVFIHFHSHNFKKTNFKKLLFLAANIAFFYLSFRSRRYTAQAFPLSIVTFFIFLPKKLLPHLQLSLLVLPFLFLNTLINFRQSLLSTKLYNSHFEQTALVIKEKIPPQSLIFHANWSDSQYLLGLAPDYQYLVTLDPIYMYMWNQDLYKKYRSIAQAQEDKPLEEIQKYFPSSYVHTDKIYFYPFYKQLLDTKKVTVLYEDQVGALFKIK